MNLADKMKSTTFWITILSIVGAVILQLTDYISGEYTAYAVTASAVFYALSRGLAKYNTEMKRGYKTTEFWLALVSVVILAIQTVPGDVSLEVAGVLGIILSAAYQIARGLAMDPAGEVVLPEDEDIAL